MVPIVMVLCMCFHGLLGDANMAGGYSGSRGRPDCCSQGRPCGLHVGLAQSLKALLCLQAGDVHIVTPLQSLVSYKRVADREVDSLITVGT
jgi:hypothetical protein